MKKTDSKHARIIQGVAILSLVVITLLAFSSINVNAELSVGPKIKMKPPQDLVLSEALNPSPGGYEG